MKVFDFDLTLYLTYTAKSIKFLTSESGIGIDEKDIVTVFLINFAAFKP